MNRKRKKSQQSKISLSGLGWQSLFITHITLSRGCFQQQEVAVCSTQQQIGEHSGAFSSYRGGNFPQELVETKPRAERALILDLHTFGLKYDFQ